jgi:hypothetical protein
MVSTTLRRIPESADRPWAADLNRLIDAILGNNGAQTKLVGHDGTVTDPYTGAATGSQYALVVQSLAGLHILVINAASSGNVLVVADSGVTIFNLSVTNDLTVGGRLVMTAAASRLVPGATSFSIRNNADGADNLFVTDAGAVSSRTSLTAATTVNAGTGLTVSTGTITMAAATSQMIPGTTSFAIRNHASSADNLLVTDAGAVTARTTVTGTTGVTATAGDVTITAGKISMAAAASQLVPGATSFSIRNSANSLDNLSVTDAGNVAIRGTLSAGATTMTTLHATGAATLDGTLAVAGASTLAALTCTTLSAANTATMAAINASGIVTVSNTLSAQEVDISGANTVFALTGTTQTQTTVGAAGGASALPATPSSYMKIKIGASSFVIPVYLP